MGGCAGGARGPRRARGGGVDDGERERVKAGPKSQASASGAGVSGGGSATAVAVEGAAAEQCRIVGPFAGRLGQTDVGLGEPVHGFRGLFGMLHLITAHRLQALLDALLNQIGVSFAGASDRADDNGRAAKTRPAAPTIRK